MTYEILSKETMYNGPIFSVDRVEISLPDSRARKYDMIHIQDAVTILPLDQNGNVLFVKQYRVGSNSILLELPAGKIEIGESAQFTAEREIREETGFAANKMQPLGKFFVSPGYSTEYMYTFLATGLFSSPLNPDADEFLNLVKIPLQETLNMIRNGQIEDCKTLSAFMQALPYLKSEK
jgi:ADP-ribose pyrophosphatase